MVTSGETDTRALEKMGGHVLGPARDAPEDKIMFKLEVDLASRGQNSGGTGELGSQKGFCLTERNRDVKQCVTI